MRARLSRVDSATRLNPPSLFSCLMASKDSQARTGPVLAWIDVNRCRIGFDQISQGSPPFTSEVPIQNASASVVGEGEGKAA